MISHHDRGILASELSNALTGLPTAELDRVLDELDDEAKQGLLERLGSHLTPEQLRDGFSSFVVGSLPVLSFDEELELAAMVRRTLLSDISDFGRFRELTAQPSERLSASALRVGAVTFAFEDPTVACESLTMLDVSPALQVPWHDRLREPELRSWRDRIRLLHSVSTHDIEVGTRPAEAGTHGGAPTTTGTDATSSIEEALQRADGLFSAVDHIMIRATLSVANDVHGAPSPEQLRRGVEEFVRLNADRRCSTFHLGFLVAAGTASESLAPLRGDRQRWFHFGRICGLIHLGDDEALVKECMDHRRTVLELVNHRLMGAVITGGVVRALMVDHAPIAAEMLSAREHPLAGALDLYRDAYWWARMLVISARSSEAEPLFAALEGLPLRINDEVAERQRHADLVRRRTNCRRSLDDFVAAEALLDTVGLAELDERTLAQHHAERGLVAARIRHLSHLSFPADESDRIALRERLVAAEKHFSTALEHDPQDLRATYALGVLAACERDHAASLNLLERAEAGLKRDPVLSRTALIPRARFHRAAATLALLEPGTDAAAVDSAVQSIEEGYRPPMMTVLEALEALETHGSRHTARFVAAAVEVVDDLEPLVPALISLLADHHDELLEPVGRLVVQTRLPRGSRFELHGAMLRAAARLGDEHTLATSVEALDDLVSTACDVDLDRRWAEMLEQEPSLREALDPAEADLLRAGVLQRIGDLAEAREAIIHLLYRVSQGAIDRYDHEDLLELLERLGAGEGEIEPLRRLARPRPDQVGPAQLDRPVHVLFAGGNETQEQYESQIEEALLERFGPSLTVQWFRPGWDMNWSKDAERIEAAMPLADAIVIMTYMRTNLGRRLRKAAKGYDLIWRSCTGQGRASLERSIVSAVEGVLTKGTVTTDRSEV